MCSGERCNNRTIEIWISLWPGAGYNVQHWIDNTIPGKTIFVLRRDQPWHGPVVVFSSVDECLPFEAMSGCVWVQLSQPTYVLSLQPGVADDLDPSWSWPPVMAPPARMGSNTELPLGRESYWGYPMTLRWRHNGKDCVSNHQPHHCLLSRLFGHRSK